MANYSKYFPMVEYYNKFVKPINPKRYFMKKGLMLCPLHPDVNPSLGIITSKSKGEICHCFGCNYVGNVVEFHQAVNRRLLGKYLSEDDAKLDLCRIFGVDYNDLPLEDKLNSVDKEIKREFELSKSLDGFDIGDFRYMIREGKKKKKGIAYFNTLLMVMTNEVKNEEE